MIDIELDQYSLISKKVTLENRSVNGPPLTVLADRC